MDSNKLSDQHELRSSSKPAEPYLERTKSHISSEQTRRVIRALLILCILFVVPTLTSYLWHSNKLDHWNQLFQVDTNEATESSESIYSTDPTESYETSLDPTELNARSGQRIGLF